MSECILWFRQDLRLSDNPALQAAIKSGHTIVPIYIHDTTLPWHPGAASRWWLHHSLSALQKALRELGSDLLVFSGKAEKVLLKLCSQHQVSEIYWNRCYEPAVINRDSQLKLHLQKQSINVHSFNASLLAEPWEVLKKDQTPYRVFTAFWNTLQRQGFSHYQSSSPTSMPSLPATQSPDESMSIDELELLPAITWDKAFYRHWSPGENNSSQRLQTFAENNLQDYPQERDIPALDSTSHSSMALHFGEVSPWRVVREVHAEANSSDKMKSLNAGEKYLRQLAWREFAHHLLYHFPDTTQHPLDKRFESMQWHPDSAARLHAWQSGNTGIPLVDAGMRQLWSTGWMHNRVRMVAASFLTKNLQVSWLDGARWFWDTLVDADLANNTMGWQWVAGCGADAAPYFRVFNPVRQGERFDPDGSYVRNWVPELTTLPAKWIHQPWAAPDKVMAEAGIQLGKDYPLPLVDLAESRQNALDSWDLIKTQHPG
jgi:deoxyribodipyrimidine photo-lyase